MELLKTPLKQVDLCIEKLGVKIDVKPSVYVAQRSVHLGPSVLAELAVENDWDVVLHDVLDGVLGAEKVSLHRLGRVQIQSVSYVSPLVLVVEPAIDYEVVLDAPHHVAERFVADSVDVWVPAIVHPLKKRRV